MKTGRALAEEIRSTQPQSGTVAFWWLGQLSFIVKTSETTIILDPFLKPSERRKFPPLGTPEDFAGLADVITGSHDHSDHIDRATLPSLLAANPQAKLVIPQAIEKIEELGAKASQIVGMDDGMVWEGVGVRITAIKAAHELLHRNGRGYLNLSFIIESGGATILHTGDACIYEGMTSDLKRWIYDLAILPINGRDAVRLKRGCIGNMTYQEAADLAGALGPKLTVPGHFDMFEGNCVDPQPFADYMAVKYPKLNCIIPKHGELFVVK